MNLRKLLRPRNIVLLSILAVVVIGLVVIITLPSGASSSSLSAQLSEINGVVQVRDGAQSAYNQVNNGFLLNAVMQLQTKEESKVRLDLSTGSIVRLGPSTFFFLQSEQAAAGGVLTQIKLQAGRLWTILNGGSLEVNTPGGLASVRGSYLSVWVEAGTNQIAVSCLEGHCGFQDAAGSVQLTSGQKVISSNTNVLPAVEKMDQSDLQDWLNNCPEAAAIVPQVINLLATSTPTLATTLSTETVTATPTPTSLLTSTPVPLSGSVTITPALAGTLTPTQGASPTPSVTPANFAPTATRATLPAGAPTSTASAASTATVPGSTPVPTGTPLPLPSSTLAPAPSNTPVPLPSNTPLPLPSNTPVPLPSNTPVPPPTNTPVPPPTSTPVPYP